MVIITRDWTLDRVHSRRLLDRLQYVFALYGPLTMTFDLSTPILLIYPAI